MKERLPIMEAPPSVELRVTEEESLLKQAAKSQAGRWLAATMLALSVEAASPSKAEAQNFFDWYRLNYETEISGGIDPISGTGMGTLTIRERSESERRRISHDPDLSIVRGIEPDPLDSRFLRGGFTDRELRAIDRRARIDRETHPEDYEGVEGRLPAELPVLSDLIQHGPWESELLPDHVYIDENGSRYLMRSIPADADDAEFIALGRDAHRWLPGRFIQHDSRVISSHDGTPVERFLFEAPPIIDTARLEGNWYEDLRPGHIYTDDSERFYVVVENSVEAGRTLSGYRDTVLSQARAVLGRDVVIIEERRFEQPPMSEIPSRARYLVAERLVDIYGDPIERE